MMVYTGANRVHPVNQSVSNFPDKGTKYKHLIVNHNGILLDTGRERSVSKTLVRLIRHWPLLTE